MKFNWTGSKIRYSIGILGIVIMIFGWLISNVDYFLFIYRIIAPKYSNSISAFNRMKQKNFILKKGDIGFFEISEILEKSITGDRTPIITQIKTLSWEEGPSLVRTPEGAKWCDYYFKLEISFSNGRPVTATFYDLKYLIEKMYLTKNIFLSSSIIFWFGTFISLVSIFL